MKDLETLLRENYQYYIRWSTQIWSAKYLDSKYPPFSFQICKADKWLCQSIFGIRDIMGEVPFNWVLKDENKFVQK